MDITHKQVLELFDYDRETGLLSWRSSRGRIRQGEAAGHATVDRTGCRYYRVGVFGKKYMAHRLAWLYVTGVWPEHQIDHIDGDGLNNRWDNLREVTNQENQQNRKRMSRNTSGVIGVSFDKGMQKWSARIKAAGKYQYLGCYDKLEDAAKARKDAEEKYGFHKSYGIQSNEQGEG